MDAYACQPEIQEGTISFWDAPELTQGGATEFPEGWIDLGAWPGSNSTRGICIPKRPLCPALHLYTFPSFHCAEGSLRVRGHWGMEGGVWL